MGICSTRAGGQHSLKQIYRRQPKAGMAVRERSAEKLRRRLSGRSARCTPKGAGGREQVETPLARALLLDPPLPPPHRLLFRLASSSPSPFPPRAAFARMTTPHVIASSSGHHSQSATSNGVVGNHFRVGKKIGEGSFGVVFEGMCILHLCRTSRTD